jgi:hypothetical protein
LMHNHAGSEKLITGDPTNGRASLDATRDDRDWFERNVRRDYRVRDPKPFEFGRPLDLLNSERAHVVVKRSDDGEHVRTPVFVAFKSPVVDDTDDAISVLLIDNKRHAHRS